MSNCNYTLVAHTNVCIKDYISCSKETEVYLNSGKVLATKNGCRIIQKLRSIKFFSCLQNSKSKFT